MEKKIKEWTKKCKKYKIKVEDVDEERKKVDPVYAFFARDKAVHSPIKNEFWLEHADRKRYNKQIESNTGRYPVGFRHYENYYNYKVVYPESTIQEYSDASK